VELRWCRDARRSSAQDVHTPGSTRDGIALMAAEVVRAPCISPRAPTPQPPVAEQAGFRIQKSTARYSTARRVTMTAGHASPLQCRALHQLHQSARTHDVARHRASHHSTQHAADRESIAQEPTPHGTQHTRHSTHTEGCSAPRAGAQHCAAPPAAERSTAQHVEPAASHSTANSSAHSEAPHTTGQIKARRS
jgi:hypothetical protein